MDEHVLLKMGTSRIVSRQEPKVDFLGLGQKHFCKGAQSGKIAFSPLQTKNTTFFAKKVMVKCF